MASTGTYIGIGVGVILFIVVIGVVIYFVVFSGDNGGGGNNDDGKTKTVIQANTQYLIQNPEGGLDFTGTNSVSDAQTFKKVSSGKKTQDGTPLFYIEATGRNTSTYASLSLTVDPSISLFVTTTGQDRSTFYENSNGIIIAYTPAHTKPYFGTKIGDITFDRDTLTFVPISSSAKTASLQFKDVKVTN